MRGIISRMTHCRDGCKQRGRAWHTGIGRAARSNTLLLTLEDTDGDDDHQHTFTYGSRAGDS
jgi:hypothetical protein